MGFDFTKTQLAKIKEKVEELDQEHSDVEGFDFDASEARFMQKLEKKMEDPLVLELRQEFTKAIQKLSLEINEIEMMLRGNLKIQSSESIKDIPAFARKSSKEVMDFEESMESPASMMSPSYSRVEKKQSSKFKSYSSSANERSAEKSELSKKVDRMESELQKMADLNQKSFDEFEKFRDRFRQIFEDSDFIYRFDKMMGNQEQYAALQKKSSEGFVKFDSETREFFREQFVYQLEKIQKSHENSLREIRESNEKIRFAVKEKAEETIKTLQMGITQLRNEMQKLEEKLAKTEEKLRKRKKFFWFF